MTYATATYVFICLAVGGYEAFRKREATFDFLFFFNVSFIVYFGLAPLHMIIGGEEYATLPNVYIDLFADLHAGRRLFLMGLLVILAYVCTIAGYHLGTRLPAKMPLEYLGTDEHRVRVTIGLSIVIGAISLALYVAQFGSLSEPFLEAGYIRTGDFQTTGALVFLQKFIPLLAVPAPIYVATLMNRTRGSRSGWQVALFVLFLLLGCVALLTQGSRRVWMIYAMEFYFLAANWNRRVYVTSLAFVVVLSVAVLLLGDIASVGLGLGVRLAGSEFRDVFASTWQVLYAAAWRDFTYTFQAMVAIVERYHDFPRLFVDLPLTVLQMVPERLLPISMPEAVETKSTLLVAQVPVPLINEIPPGYVGFFWYSAYLPGVIIGCLGFGWVGRITARFLLPFARTNAVGMLLYTWAGFVWGYWLREGSTYMILIERMHWVVAGLMLIGLGSVWIRTRESAVHPA